MADNEGASREKEQSLDFLSANFDPLRALYTKDLKPPIPSIQVFNNLGEYARVIKEGRPKTVQKDPRKSASLISATSKRTRNLKPEYKPPDISTRLKAIASDRVAQEYLLLNEKRDSISGQDEDGLSKDKQNALGFGRGWSGKKKYMNVLEKMDACATGPFSILYKCLDKRYKVQVWIRKYKGLRSVLTGYVIAFDKHMNLALMDVDEVYTTEEHHREECCAKEEKVTKKKKKKKTKKPSIQIKENLIDTDKKENVSVGFTPLGDKINIKTVPELNENSVPPVKESTTAQDVGTDLMSVGDLNRPFKSLKSDYDKYQTEFKSSEEATVSILKDEETSSLLPLVTTKECDKTETLSTDQLASLSRQWIDEQEQKRKKAHDSQQQIIKTDTTELPMDLGSEQTGYLFSHDLKVRVPAHENLESQDMEFTVVGIFQPVLTTVESNADKSAMLPENLEINVPLLFSNTTDKNEEMKDHTLKLEKPVRPVLTELAFEPVLHGIDIDGDSSDQVVQFNKPEVPVFVPVLHGVDIEGDSSDQVVQQDKPEVPVLEPVLHGVDIDGDSSDQVVQLNKPEVPVLEPVLHGVDIDVDSSDQVVQQDKPEVPVFVPVLHGVDIDVDSSEQVVQQDKPEVPVFVPVLHGIDIDGESSDQVVQLNKPDVPVFVPVLHGVDIDGDSSDQVVQLNKPDVPLFVPVLHGIDIDGDSSDQVVQRDKPDVPVFVPVLHGIDIDGDSSDQVVQLDKPDAPVFVPVLHGIDIDGDSSDQLVQSDNVVTPTTETISKIDSDKITAQDDKNIAAEIRLTEQKSVICKESSYEEESLRVCDFGDDIADKPNTEPQTKVNFANYENSVICEGNSKERQILRNLSALEPENPDVASVVEVRCISEEKEIRGERVLEELDVQVEPEEKVKTLHPRGPKSTKQSKTEGNPMEAEDVTNIKGKCFTYDNENEYKGDSESIGKMNQGIEYCEKDEVERKDLSPASDLTSTTSSEEWSVSVGNKLTMLSWEDSDSAVRESGVQEKPCENDVDGSVKEEEESWKQSLSGESETKRGTEADIGYVVAEPGCEDKPCKNKYGNFHRGIFHGAEAGPEEIRRRELLSSVKKNDTVADPGAGDEPDGLYADPEESSPCESLSSVTKNDTVADPGAGSDPHGLEEDPGERRPCKSLSSVKKNGTVADPGAEDDPHGLEEDPGERRPCESLSSVKKNGTVADPGAGDDRDGLNADPEESSPCESLSSVTQNDTVADPGVGSDPHGLEEDPGERRPCKSLSSVKKIGTVADPGAGDDPHGLEEDPGERRPCESLSSVKKKNTVADPGAGNDRDALNAVPEEISPCESLSSVKKNDAVAESETRDDPHELPAKPQERIREEPIRKKKSKESRCQLDGKDKEDKSTQSSEGMTREDQQPGGGHGKMKSDMKDKDEEKDVESEKEEGEITSSDDEEPAQNTQVDQPQHGGTKNDQPRKLSVWERLGFRDKARREESARKGEGENYEKKRRDERKQETRRNKDDEMKDKDQGRSISGEHKRKNESGRRNEGKERRDMKMGERKGSVESEQGSSREKDVGMKRRERQSTRSGERDSVRSDLPQRNVKERKDDRKKTEHKIVIDATEKPSHDAVSSANQPRKKMEGKVDGKTRKRRPSSRKEKDGQIKEDGGKSRVTPHEAGTERSKKDKEKKLSGENEKARKLSSTEIKKNEVKQRGISSDVEKNATRTKEKISDGEKERRLTKDETKKDERRERTLQPQGHRDSEKRSTNDTRHGVQARESVCRKEKKEASLSSSRNSGEPQGDHPTKTCSSDAKELVLKECSSDKKKTNEVIKAKKTIEISKPEKGSHRLSDQKKHRQPKGEGSELKPVKPKTSEQPQGTQPRERRQEDRFSERNNHKDTKVDKTQETQSEKSSSQLKSGRGAEVAKQIDANRPGNIERDTNNQRTSTRKKVAEKLTSHEKAKTEKTDMKQVKVGLLPTPVLEMKTSVPGRFSGNDQRNIVGSTVRACILGNDPSESRKIIRNEKKAQKSSETRSKRKRSTENGRSSVKRQKRTEISEKNSPKLLNPQEQFKRTSKKEKSISEPEVKSTREKAGSGCRSSKDMGGESEKGICTARRIEIGKGKYLEFKRRHVNQLFVRGDNIVMIGYAT